MCRVYTYGHAITYELLGNVALYINECTAQHSLIGTTRHIASQKNKSF